MLKTRLIVFLLCLFIKTQLCERNPLKLPSNPLKLPLKINNSEIYSLSYLDGCLIWKQELSKQLNISL